MPRQHSQNAAIGDAWNAQKVNDINTDLDDLFANGSDRGRVQLAMSETPLMIDIAAFTYRIGSGIGNYAGATDVAVVDDADNYVEINSGGTVSINQVGWDPQKARLALVTALDGEITSITIYRPDVVGGDLSGGGEVDIDNLAFDQYGRLSYVEINSIPHTLTYQPPTLGFDLQQIETPSVTQTILRDNLGKLISIKTT